MNAGTITAVLELNASGFSSGIQSAQQQLKTFSDSSKSAGDRLIGLGTGMSALGSTLTKGVTLPLVGIGTAAVKTAADFEAAMSKTFGRLDRNIFEKNSVNCWKAKLIIITKYGIIYLG